MTRTIPSFSVLLTLLTAACAIRSPETAAPTPSPPAVPATLALPPASTPRSRPTALPPTGVPGELEEIPFPYLPPDRPLRLSKIDMQDPSNGWAVFESEEGLAHLLKTADSGLTWIDVSPPESLPVDSVLGGPSRFHMAAWSFDARHAWLSLSFNARPTIKTIWRTVDGGKSWERGLLGRRNFGSDWILFDFVDRLYGWAVIDVFHGAGSHSGELFRTMDGGMTWERMLVDFGNASGIDFLDRRVGWVSTDIFPGVSPPWGLSITRDGGQTWDTVAPGYGSIVDGPISGYQECSFVVLRAQSAGSGVIRRPDCAGYDEQGHLIQSSWLDYTIDGGQTWQSSPMPGGRPEFASASVGWVIGPTDRGAALPPSSWSLFMTRDGGRTWGALRELDWLGELSFVDDRNGWGLDEEGRLRRTADGGLTWEEVPARTAANAVPQDTTEFIHLPAEPKPISLTNASRLQLLATLPADDPTSLLIFRDSLYVGNAHGQLLHWDLGPQVHQGPAIWRVHTDWVYDLATVDDGGDLFSASRDGLVRRWPLFSADGWWDEFPIHTGEVLSVALSPDGTMLASGGEDASVKVMDIPSAAPPEVRLDLRGHQGWVWDVAFSGDGKLLASASGDGAVRVWSAQTGQPLATLSGHSSSVSQVAFVPRGGQLASASWDGTVRIWDGKTYDLLRVLEGHADWALGLAYAPAGNLLVSSGADGRVLLWDPNKGEMVSQLVVLDVPVRGVAFDAQGRYLAAVADDDRVLIWGVPAE